jgi:hypothetical protein
MDTIECFAMKPLYFPYTYINRRTAEALSACLGPATVYGPTTNASAGSNVNLVEDGLVDMRYPITADEDRLTAMLNDFRTWAALQGHRQGVGADYLRAIRNKLPFFDDTASSQIRADIKGRMGAGAPARPQEQSAAASLLAARVFLCIAQDLDRQTDAVRGDLEHCAEMERDLLQSLQGEPETESPPPSAGDAASGREVQDFMVIERLDAWRQLMAADAVQSGADASALLVTTSRYLFDQLVDRFENADRIAHAASVPVSAAPPMIRWRTTVAAILQAQVAGDNRGRLTDIERELASIPAERRVMLDVFRIPNRTPATVLGALAQPRGSGPAVAGGAGPQNTLIGCVCPVGANF